MQVVSEEGLNVYGAVTWGQFFVYQGFNEHCGWMHTSSNVDVADLYAEKIIKKNNQLFYEYNKALKPVTEKIISLSYKKDDVIQTKIITAYFTHHGPIMASRDGQWISVKGYNRSLKSLIQSWQRTKTKGFEDYKKNMALSANTSNNTVFADDKGNIAYWHGDFIPREIKNTTGANRLMEQLLLPNGRACIHWMKLFMYIIQQLAGYKIVTPLLLLFLAAAVLKKKIILHTWRRMEKISGASMQ